MPVQATTQGPSDTPDTEAVSADFPREGEWGKHPGRTASLCSSGQTAASLPGAVRTFPHATSSSSPKRLCRVSLFPAVLHTRGATSFGSAWKSWRQAWKSRRDGVRRDGCQYPLPPKKQRFPRDGHSKWLCVLHPSWTSLPVPGHSLQGLILPALRNVALTLMTR